MEKRFDITLTQGYVYKVAGMLNAGMIPVNNMNSSLKIRLQFLLVGLNFRVQSNE